MTSIMLYTVYADRDTGEWRQDSLHKTGLLVDKTKWVSQDDNDREHFDTFEHNGDTCAVCVTWE